MEAPVADGPLGSLPSQSQGGRREWRKVSDVPNGRETPGNQTRPNQLTRPRPGNLGQRRTSQNGRLFHSMSEHPSDSDPHGGDGGGHLMGGRVSPQELSSQNIGHENVLYEEMHRQQQSEHASLSTMSMESGIGGMENVEDALEQRLHNVSRQREQLQQAEVELKAQFFARAEVHRIQNSFEQQSKQHADVVVNLQNQLHDRDQKIHHLEQTLEEREQQLRASQMQANEAVWAKDGLLREQSNELAALRREHESAVAEHKAAAAQLDAERSDFLAQVEHLKEQVHDKERHAQEIEEQGALKKVDLIPDILEHYGPGQFGQNRTAQDMLLFKDGQLQDAQAWMARAQELDAYHVHANNTLNAELRDRSDQLNQLWMGQQRQLADMERYHAQVVQQLQAELSDAREQSQVLNGSAAELMGAQEERPSQAGIHVDLLHREGYDESVLPATRSEPTNKVGVVRGNSIILPPGNVESVMPFFRPPDSSTQGDHTTGLPLLPSPVVMGVNPAISSEGLIPATQHFSLQQSLTAAPQNSPSAVPQTPLSQLQGHSPVYTTTQHLVSLQQQHHQTLQQQPPSQVPAHNHSLHKILPSQQHQLQVLEHEASQQHGIILLSHLSSTKTPVSSVQPPVRKVQQEAMVSEPLQPLREDQQVQLLSHASKEKQHVELSSQQHQQMGTQQERQRQEQQQQSQNHKQLPVQHHDEALQLQHQQGISSTMHRLSRPAALASEDGQPQHNLSRSNSIIASQELRNPTLSPVTSQQTSADLIKGSEPVLLNEKSLLACLVRAVPAEASAKIRISSTLPNRLGKMLAPLHWHDYRKQYGRLDEFVSSHMEFFVIEGDYIHLREGAHALVSTLTAVAKAAAAAAAAAAGPVSLDRVPTVAVTPVSQVSQMQRGRNLKNLNKEDSKRSQSQLDELNTHKQQKPIPLDHLKNGQQHSRSFTARSNAGNPMSASNNGGSMEAINNVTGRDYVSNGLTSGKGSVQLDNGDASSHGDLGGTSYHRNRQQSSRPSLSGSGLYRKQENHYKAQAQEGRPSSTPVQLEFYDDGRTQERQPATSLEVNVHQHIPAIYSI